MKPNFTYMIKGYTNKIDLNPIINEKFVKIYIF